ncbi:MAG: 3-dehydroquinate synthase, partial [Gammaproteobacteria bacterium]
PQEINAERFIELMGVDKKNVDGQIRLILLKGIGEATLPVSVENELLEMTLNTYGRK